MSRVDQMSRDELITRLAGVILERDDAARELDRERVLNEDLRRELADLRMFRLRMGEVVRPGATDDQVVETTKVWLVFFRQVGALCPRAGIPGTMLDWIREIKIKASEFDRTVH
jgi:hypothetical protein